MRTEILIYEGFEELDAFGPFEVLVDDGEIITAGAVTAGIDLALWLVERRRGKGVAGRVADGIEGRAPRTQAGGRP